MAGKTKHVPVDLTPGPLPGSAITWKCWQVVVRHVPGQIMERERRGEPIEVSAPSFFLARHEACKRFRCEPLHVDAEPILPRENSIQRLRKNGKAR